MVTYLNLVPVRNEEDPLLAWLKKLQCWSQLESLWLEINTKGFTGYIPLHVELELKDEVGLDAGCLELFRQLEQEDNGLDLLKTFGVSPKEVEEDLQKGYSPWAQLVNIHLARVQDLQTLKATPIIFDKRIKYLVGYSPTL